MQRERNAKRFHPAAQARLAAGAALAAAALIAGCGGAAKHSSGATRANHTAPASTSPAAQSTAAAGAKASATGAATSKGAAVPDAVAFAKCMRANGVTNFPDPSPSGGFVFDVPPGTRSAPAFRSAQAKCQRLLPLATPGGGAPASRQTIVKLLRVARCMRAHGVHQFPDPLASRPANLSPERYGEITDFDGAFLLFPRTMNLQAPAYRHALSACGSPPLGLPH